MTIDDKIRAVREAQGIYGKRRDVWTHHQLSQACFSAAPDLIAEIERLREQRRADVAARADIAYEVRRSAMQGDVSLLLRLADRIDAGEGKP